MLFRKTNLQRTKKIGDILAVQVWMDYAPDRLPEYWRETLILRGVGALKRDGTVRLTRRGRRLRAELLATPCDATLQDLAAERDRGGGERNEWGALPLQEATPALDVVAPPPSEPAAPGQTLWGRRPWREILARCTEELAPVPPAPRLGYGPRRSDS
jgi:hypothetical protein